MSNRLETKDTSMMLESALALVKAAGYRVTKPKPKKKDRVGPTFVATFADGQVTRMSTYTSLEKLDVARGQRLSFAAYRSRHAPKFVPPFTADTDGWHDLNLQAYLEHVDTFIMPPIVAWRFEQDGQTLAASESLATAFSS